MTNVPILSCSKISEETGKHLPIFTVVTDLGSAHCLWFANGVEKLFVGSDKVKQLAMQRGKVPEEKIILAGLPIRHEFALQSEFMGDRHSPDGKAYQLKIREQLELPHTDRRTLLLMGGGEGVGSLSNLVNAIYVELVTQGIDSLILVVCGRNEKLKKELDTRDWNEVVRRWQAAKERNGIGSRILSGDVCMIPTTGCIDGGAGTVTGSIRRILSQGSMSIGNAMSMPLPRSTRNQSDESKARELDREARVAAAQLDYSTLQGVDSLVEPVGNTPGQVDVVGLGFLTNIADYMVAADILISKAGPGTISEAAALSLPIMLTSFLPGQEEGNVDYVVEGGFGAYCSDSDPIGVAEEVCMWLTDDSKLQALSRAAKAKGAPYAARDIAKAIGESTLRWKELNEHP